MTSTDLHDLYRRWLAELWNGSPDAAHHLVTDGFVGHWPDLTVTGPDQLRDVVAETHAMFTGLEFHLEVGPLVDGDLVAARWVGSGSADGTPVHFAGNDILRVRDGRFEEYWVGTVSPG